MIEKASIYDQSFQDQFNNSDFYANPRKTKIHLKIEDNDHIIGNSIVFDTETSNEQIPVYAYNSSVYAKYLNGKTVITGMIALRKTTIDRILSMVQLKDKKNELEKELESLNESIINLNKLSVTNDERESNNYRIAYMIQQKQKLMDKIREDLDLWYSKETGYDMTDDTKDLLYLRKAIGNSEISFKLVYETDLTDREETINDILFVKKSQDISIDKSEIIEVYQFIGNPVPRL
ncbi:MAG: hypothetical protein ACRC92_18415 [Peptostreptococcaceae bacterium]